MLNKAGVRKLARTRRQRHVRKKVKGTPMRPRLSVFKSAKHIYAQLIDDVNGQTLATVSSLSRTFLEGVEGVQKASGGNVEGARIVGGLLAAQAHAKGITRIIFDRNGFLYHGRVKAIAEAARAVGLQF